MLTRLIVPGVLVCLTLVLSGCAKRTPESAKKQKVYVGQAAAQTLESLRRQFPGCAEHIEFYSMGEQYTSKLEKKALGRGALALIYHRGPLAQGGVTVQVDINVTGEDLPPGNGAIEMLCAVVESCGYSTDEARRLVERVLKCTVDQNGHRRIESDGHYIDLLDFRGATPPNMRMAVKPRQN